MSDIRMGNSGVDHLDIIPGVALQMQAIFIAFYADRGSRPKTCRREASILQLRFYSPCANIGN
jgi:hypothetical protein